MLYCGLFRPNSPFRTTSPQILMVLRTGGGGWESNPPGTLLSPTLVLKTRSATRSPHTSRQECVARAADHLRAPKSSSRWSHPAIWSELATQYNPNRAKANSSLGVRHNSARLYKASIKWGVRIDGTRNCTEDWHSDHRGACEADVRPPSAPCQRPARPRSADILVGG